MMYWKAFKIGDLFERSGKHIIKESAKNITKSDTKDNKTNISLISGSAVNNGIVGYVSNMESIKDNISKNMFTACTVGNVGITFYQNTSFVSTGNTTSFIFKNKCLNEITPTSNNMLAKYISYIFCNRFHGWEPGKKSATYAQARTLGCGNDFDREIILLPVKTCLEDDAVWHEDDNTPITLDTETIERIMNRIEEHKKEKTINTYVAMRAKYELERAKYVEDPAFLEKYGKMFWKSFKVGDLFERSNDHQIKASIKELITSDVKTKEFCIANITSCTDNNGIACWLKDEGEITSKKKKGYLTLATDGVYAGAVFYQNDYFVSSGHNNVLISKTMPSISSCSAIFIAKQIQKVLQNKYHGFQRSTSCGNDFNREIILLPVITNDNNEDEIFTDAMSYLYLSSMILKYQKKIDDYNAKINSLQGENNG